MRSHQEWEDLSQFFDEFATVAVVTLSGSGQQVEITGIFDNPSVDRTLSEHTYEDQDPVFVFDERDDAGICRGDTIQINGEHYDILSSPDGDGTGLVELKLSKS